jgi:hypothetical protein
MAKVPCFRVKKNWKWIYVDLKALCEVVVEKLICN